jgi:hypothetical protein
LGVRGRDDEQFQGAVTDAFVDVGGADGGFGGEGGAGDEDEEGKVAERR